MDLSNSSSKKALDRRQGMGREYMGETQLLINIILLYRTIPGGVGRNEEIAHSKKKRKKRSLNFEVVASHSRPFGICEVIPKTSRM